MESFGIWNLLKTLLESGNQTPAGASAAPSIPTGEASGEASAEEQTELSKTPPQTAPDRKNACEEYLLRHERLTGNRKK